MKAGPVTRDTTQTQTQPPSLPTSSAEDEHLKRNTDCVYFLASPLTCKKGSECEYRHSEEARMNPRDCWYWLHSNCLNPKCAFRHPPLDGLLGTGATSSLRPSGPPSQAAVSAQLPTALGSVHNSGKQGTPCYYFQNGICLKGDRCPFMHVTQSVDNLPAQPSIPKVVAPTAELLTLKKSLGGFEKCTQQKKTPQANIIKPVEVPPHVQAKPPVKAAVLNNGLAIDRTVPSTALTNNDLPRYKPTQVSPVISGNSLSRSNPSRQAQPLDDHNLRNGREPGEFLGESSPGFDVLVEDELQDSDYYQNEDDFGRMKSRGGKHLNTANEFDYGRSGDYSSVARFDREVYNEPRSYDRYGRDEDQYAWEQRRVSSERISERSSVPERRGRPRAESPEQIVESDLRYRLSKQRKVNDSRSAVSPDRREDFLRRDDRGRYVEDQRYRDHSRRDSRRLPPPDSSVSNRLQGRISLRGRSSPDSNHHESYRERDRELDRGRNWGRLSPGKPPSSSFRGTSQDRVKRRAEDFTTEGRNFRGTLTRKDESDNETSDFAAPKRLAELKGSKVSERGEERQTRGNQLLPSGEGKSMKAGNFFGHQEMEGSRSFEGPKPLSEILKRKREEKSGASEDDMVSGNKEESTKKVKGGNQIAEETSDVPSERKLEAGKLTPRNKEEFTTENTFVTADEEEEEEEGLISEENVELTKTNESQPSVQKEGEADTDERMTMGKMDEDQDLETYDQRDEEYDYEQVDDGGDLKTEEDFKTEEDDNADPEDEYLDDDDDFAKKIGVMFS